MKINVSNLGMPCLWLPPKLLLIMRLIIVILTTCFMQVSASIYAQRVTLKEINMPVAQVLKIIKQQTGYDFLYEDKVLADAKNISVNLNNVGLATALDKVFEGQNLAYTIGDGTVIVKPKEPSFLDKVVSVISNDRRDLIADIRGVVRNERGEALEGITVMVKGAKAGTRTNEKGEFLLKGVKKGDVLVFTGVAIETFEYTVKDDKDIDLNLKARLVQLEEVNVEYNTGYQNIPKERATGSFVHLDNKAINRVVSTNILDRIMNISSGLKFEPQPASVNATNISIRGFSTINANMKPLIVIDGFPYEEINAIGSGNLIFNPLNNLNPNDVESITILRDAAAASIWGARSANGVIVITTKKGNFNQATNFQFNVTTNLTAKPDLDYLKTISSKDAVEFEKARFATGVFNTYDDLYPQFKLFPTLSPVVEILLARRRNAITQQEAEQRLNALSNHDVKDDINKFFLRKSVNQQYNLNVSGGSKVYNYYASVGYDKNVSNNVGNSDSRFTLRLDNTFKALKKLEINAYVVVTSAKSFNSGVSYNSFIANGGSFAAPYTFFADDQGKPLHVPNGSTLRLPYIDTASSPGLLDWHYRPLEELKDANNHTSQFNTRIGSSIKYRIIEGLSIEAKGQYEKGATNKENYYKPSTYSVRSLINTYMFKDATGVIQYPVPVGGILDYSNAIQTTWNVRGNINLNEHWNLHEINAVAGWEASQSSYDNKQLRRYGYDPDKYTFSSNIDYKNQYITRPSGGTSQIYNPDIFIGTTDRFISYFANLGYTYNGKYTLTGSGRIDKSNFFGSKANQRLVPLWSSGLGWNISKENFYSVEWLPKLSFRGTYGYNANMNNRATALPTARYDQSSIGGFGLHNNISLSLLTPPNPGLTWEKIKIVNLALDFAILNHRVNGTLEYYSKKGVNLIGSIVSEATTGFVSYLGNYASMKGSGWDFNINSININNEFKWESNLLFSTNTDKVTDYNQSSVTTAHYLASRTPIIGKPLLKIYTYTTASLDPANGNPRGYVNGDIKDFNTVISTAKPEDLKYFGVATPKMFGSFQNTFSYKNISISTNLTYKLKYYFTRTSINYSNLMNNWGGHSDYALRWQRPGDELKTLIPSLPAAANGNRDTFYLSSDALVERGDHIRIQDLKISYDLNKANLKFMSISSMQVFIYANNLGIIWRANKQDIDPEYINRIPISKSWAFGLRVGL